MQEERLLAAFQRAAAGVPAYRRLLDEHGVDPATVVDGDSFKSRCPILTTSNTFDRFPIDQLCVDGMLTDLADVLTSSGHGGRFSFGLSTRQQQAESATLIDLALDQAFQVNTRRTLAINCLPMGVTFSSRAMTVATTSVREDMAVALIKTFGQHYDQILIVSDPLFVRRLLDYADEQGVDWTRYRVALVLGEEVFGERFRSYIAGRLGLDIDGRDAGRIISSFGVGELGLHLCYETAATIARRRASESPSMILTYDSRRTLIEVLDPDASGYGRLTISMLDTSLPVPLLRYQTGDIARFLPDSMLALRGREKERLPGGRTVADYKDALYADAAIADRFTGAFRVTAGDSGPRVHVQLVRGATVDETFERRLRAALRVGEADVDVTVSPYERFPYGMSLDYERKFAYVSF